MDAAWLADNLNIMTLDDLFGPGSSLTVRELTSLDITANAGDIGLNIVFDLADLFKGDNAVEVRLVCTRIHRAEISGRLLLGNAHVSMGSSDGHTRLTITQGGFAVMIECEHMYLAGGTTFLRTTPVKD
ncbi:Uncharacterised protein [Propionibacterium australiense]|uniref:Uncharacterized protein n=2 Tax=Propionibacterium australiense TaxID=119981 RepID=A0A383SAW1_9ACTN|nr:hypothetical protein D9T14_13150 [Propionibacterium australiense]RLP05997.1 hypothetical protein D7U36_13320 [Propionibacterium australiense]SYZ34692.1 Hypothetical protein PROPAUS_2747 [Propionibacterium australiense]VEH89197.1 Uncharacterised protein [Propionibacterium australiense]